MVQLRDFRAWAKENPNFMTPTSIKVKQIRSSFVELSSGSDLSGGTMYGVTLIRYIPNKGFAVDLDTNLNSSFSNRREADKRFRLIVSKLQNKEL